MLLITYPYCYANNAELRFSLAVGRADNAKLHHVLEFGLSSGLRRKIKAAIPMKGCLTGRFDVIENITWWPITGAGKVREAGILS